MFSAETLESKPSVKPFWLPALNPQAVKSSDRFMVVNIAEARAMESAFGPGDAAHACNVLNQDALRNGRPADYDAFRIEK